MIVFLNGQFVPEEKAVVSVLDRGFLYGDGLFETVRVYGGRPFRWPEHLARLHRGAEFLKLAVPYSDKELTQTVLQLIESNQMPESLMRLTLTRGVGPRGYSPKGAEKPNLAMTMHPAQPNDPLNPARWRLATSSLRVPTNDPVALYKTCNKLPQILARAEAEALGAHEALLLNTDGQVAESASSNVFWIESGTVCTTPLADGLLAGVTREFVVELCASLGIKTVERSVRPEELAAADAIFLTMSSLEIVPIIELDGRAVRTSPIVGRIHQAYADAVAGV
jgi:aminodeoxychorismate lyase